MSYTRGRTLWEGEVCNEGLQQVIVATARGSVGRLQWPDELPRSAAREMCHAYVQERTTYSAEDADQYVRTPWAFVRDGIGDCKSTAIFIGCMCAAAGWDVRLRFVRYHGADHYGHVYAVVGGVPVDPLLAIGAECVHLQAKDVWI